MLALSRLHGLDDSLVLGAAGLRGPIEANRHFGILVTYLRDDAKVYETYWTTGRGNEPMAPSYGLLDLTVYGRQEFWEDSPGGWPQHWSSDGCQFRLNGRPTAQWSRINAGRNDDLGTS